MGKKIYRYEIQYINNDDQLCVGVRLEEHEVIKETEQCYFIGDYYSKNHTKRVLKDAMNTYAFDTKEKAMEHFKRRTKKRISWYSYWSENCEVALKLVENMSLDDNYIEDEDNKIKDTIV